MESRRVVGVSLLVFGAAYFALTFQIPEPSGGYAAVGPRAFPFMIGIGLAASSIWIMLSGERASPAGMMSVNWLLLGLTALSFLAYILLLDTVGYVPATVGFITLESRLLGSRNWLGNLVVGCVITATVYGIFNVLLGIPLPEGLLL